MNVLQEWRSWANLGSARNENSVAAVGSQCCRAVREWRSAVSWDFPQPVPSCCALSSVIRVTVPSCCALFLGHWRGGVRRCSWGGRSRGLGENLEPGRDFVGPGGFRVLPQCVSGLAPLLSVYSCSRAVVFPTSTTLLFEGLRSGTRRRRGASASAQAGGGPGRNRGAQRPHVRALRCAGPARPISPWCADREKVRYLPNACDVRAFNFRCAVLLGPI